MLYHLAKTKKDIRDADNRLIKDIDTVTDIPGTAGVVQRGILKAGLRAKTLGEDIGLFGPETFTELPGLEGRGLRGHHAMLACSLANRIGHKTGPFARICDMQGTGIISNPVEATDLSHQKARDPSIANLTGNSAGRGTHLPGAGIIEDVERIIGKPADKLRKAIFKDLKRTRNRTRKLRDSAELLRSKNSIAGQIQKLLLESGRFPDLARGLTGSTRKLLGAGLSPAGSSTGSGLHLSGQTGGQLIPLLLAVSAAAGPITRLITSSIEAKKRKKQRGKGRLQAGSGSFEDFFKFIGQDLKKMAGKGPRDPTIGNIIGRNPRVPGAVTHHGSGIVQDVTRDIVKLSKRKNPGHALGKKLLRMHGLTPAKLHRMGISEKHLLELFKKNSITKKAIAQQRGRGTVLSGGRQEGGQFGILASLAASFIIPKIVNAIAKKKVF